jgi:2-haloacid dehalogenase
VGSELCIRARGLEQAVDMIIISSEERLAKPDPHLFQRVAERLGVKAEEIVLVDDFLVNIEGARAAGWQAIHYRPGLDVRAELEQLGVVTRPKYPQP